MDSKTFRAMGDYAVDQIAKFLDEHPGWYPVMRIKPIGHDGPIIVVGIETEDDDGEAHEGATH